MGTPALKVPIGSICKGTDLGIKDIHKYIFRACISCGKPSWARVECGKPRAIKCRPCSYWRKGGRYTNWQGYVLILIKADNPFCSMTTKRRDYPKEGGYIFEHRLVMAKALGRVLSSKEVVHHKNGIRNDNRLENLELTVRGKHSSDHNKGYQDGYNKGYLDGQTTKILELEGEIAHLHTINFLLIGGK